MHEECGCFSKSPPQNKKRRPLGVRSKASQKWVHNLEKALCLILVERPVGGHPLHRDGQCLSCSQGSSSNGYLHLLPHRVRTRNYCHTPYMSPKHNRYQGKFALNEASGDVQTKAHIGTSVLTSDSSGPDQGQIPLRKLSILVPLTRVLRINKHLALTQSQLKVHAKE